ncbi:hypothetical protein GOODEAATRI_024573 [Goodea atripinnis]|uniref:Uncharacterized protein n=1 Tax=Goodea atripinnis TaxID=208336 RepID=A0ABV0Q0R0_9TELE
MRLQLFTTPCSPMRHFQTLSSSDLRSYFVFPLLILLKCSDSLPSFGMRARHVFTPQANCSRVWINHVETGSCNRARIRFAGQFQGPGCITTGVTPSRNWTLACYKVFQRFVVKPLSVSECPLFLVKDVLHIAGDPGLVVWKDTVFVGTTSVQKCK